MKLWRSLLGLDTVSRYSGTLDPADTYFSYNGIRYPVTGGSVASSNAEDIPTDFISYVQQLYQSDGVVFAVMLARQMLFSEARFLWQEMRQGRPGDLFWTRDLAALEEPWPNATTGELLARMDQDTSLAGSYYMVREEERFRRLRPDWLTIVLSAPPDKATRSDVTGYWYHPGRTYSQPKAFDPDRDEMYLPDEMCHWSPIPDPLAQYRGMSWLTPVVREVQSDKAATEHKARFFDNGATIGLVISAKESLTEEQFKDFQANFNGAHTGVDNAYRPLFFADPVDVAVSGLDLRQLDFKATQGAGETRIAAAGGVPPIIVGLSEGLASATYSNYSMARRKFGDHWARPQWRSAAAAVAPLLTRPTFPSRLWYDDRDIAFLREDQKDAAEIQQLKAATINAYIAAGWTPDSSKASVDADDRSLLVHSGLVSVQLQPPGSGAGPVRAVATRAVPLVIEGSVQRRFDPSEARDPHSGKWVDTGGVIGDVLDFAKGAMHIDGDGNGDVDLAFADTHTKLSEDSALEFADKIDQAIDPQGGWRVGRTDSVADYPPGDPRANPTGFASIKRLGGDEYEVELLDTASTLRLDRSEAGRLRDEIHRVSQSRRAVTDAGPATAVVQRDGRVAVSLPATTGQPLAMDLTPREVKALDSAITDGIAAIDEYDPELGLNDVAHTATVRLGSTEVTVTAYGRYGQPSGRLVLAADGWELRLPDVQAERITEAFDPVLYAHLLRSRRRLGGSTSVARAKGRPGDTGGRRLHEYWTRGEGLAKWAQSPTPWTTLYHHLLKFMPPGKAKRTAAQWFHDVMGFWPGADMNRVVHGKPPRGERVGPG